MTREYEPDPEVLADLRLRAQSERDRPRTEEQVRAVYAWKPSPVVGKWKCRNRACSTLCDVTADAMDHWATSNDICRRRGWPTIETHEVMVCDRCKVLLDAKLGERRRDTREQTATLIQRLKASSSPRNERGIVEQLEKLGHPDIVGLLEALEGKSSTRKGKANL